MAQYFAGHGPEPTYDSSHVAPFSTLEHLRTLAASSDFSTKPKLERELRGNGPNRRVARRVHPSPCLHAAGKAAAHARRPADVAQDGADSLVQRRVVLVVDLQPAEPLLDLSRSPGRRDTGALERQQDCQAPAQEIAATGAARRRRARPAARLPFLLPSSLRCFPSPGWGRSSRRCFAFVCALSPTRWARRWRCAPVAGAPAAGCFSAVAPSAPVGASCTRIAATLPSPILFGQGRAASRDSPQ